ncbi:ABC transporter permease [Paludibaculum fermentans]|uniref:ABC transporter permease n=1 Tax=Paludibaculum fermentans TaxID=1473598 RepID=A0A7S7NTU8_PALFE|nr:ABC transporter permease [Paludibaculum fermentans]QOY89640.1 ABC transporter permease [Paludibaculum fermentans]
MNWIQRLRFLVRKNETDVELDEELRFHLDRQIELNLANGMPPAEARYAAMQEFGIVEQIKEECRSSRGMDWLNGIAQDVRYALRNFRRNRSFALTVLAVTAIGIGSSTAVFSVVDRILFRSLPYADASRLVSMGISIPWMDYDFLTWSDYAEFKRTPTKLQSVTSWTGVVDCDLTGDRPLRLACARVEASFLPVLGIQPVLGRNFVAEEDRPNVPGVALITHAMWQNRFGGLPSTIGHKLTIDGTERQIIGILPPDFELPTLEKADLVIPQAMPPLPAGGGRPMQVYGRLQAGATPQQLRDAVMPLADRLFSFAPPAARKQLKFQVKPLQEMQSGNMYLAAWTLLGAVLAMLLIACANVANLLLARALARQRELAVRAALGASRGRLVRQTLTESMLLSLSGGAAGILLAYGLLRVFVYIAPAGLPHLTGARLDLRVLGFTVAASLLCGFIFGLAPSLHTPSASTISGTRATPRSSMITRHALVSAQLSFSLILLTCAGLLLQSLWNRQRLSLGMRTDHVVTAEMALTIRYSQPSARLAFFESLEQRLARLPGVETVALSDSLPPGGVPRSQPLYALEGSVRTQAEPSSGIVVWRHVSPGYFKALGIPILKGRPFTEEDRGPKQMVVILSQSLASLLFPGEDALGKQMRRFPKGPLYTVVGIASSVRNGGLIDANHPEYYMVRRHSDEDALAASAVIVRGQAKPELLESWIRSEVAALDPVIPPLIQTFDQHMGELAARPRFQALLLALFAAIGLILSASGLYGLISYLAAQREREIGVRLALGATPSQILRMILAHAFRWTSAGLVFGIAGAAAAAYGLRGLLFHIQPADPAAFASAAVSLALVALLAALLPSRRASRVDPMTTLRQD